MISATNDITGDRLISRGNSDKFKDNFDRIFGKKEALISPPIRFKDSVELGLSPSTQVQTIDCRTKAEKAAESLLNLQYDGNKIEPTI
jgi:hypothetical protein